jgi:multiple sugar transport system permease protein
VLFLAALFLVPLVETIAMSFSDNGRRVAGPLPADGRRPQFRPRGQEHVPAGLTVVPLQVALALGMASMLQKLPKGRDLILWIWTIPLGVSDLAAGLVWLAILQERGYLTSALAFFGLVDGPTQWLTYETPGMLFGCVLVAEVWRATAIVFIILVAGLQLIPKEYREAAEIFGASPWTIFRRITLPLLKPSLQTALILRHRAGLRGVCRRLCHCRPQFSGPGGRGLRLAARQPGYGVAASYAVLIVVISLAATLFYLRVLRTRAEPRS